MEFHFLQVTEACWVRWAIWSLVGVGVTICSPDFFAVSVAAKADKCVYFTPCFEIGNTVTHHDDLVWVKFVFKLGNDFGFTTVTRGWCGGVIASVAAIRVESERDGINSVNTKPKELLKYFANFFMLSSSLVNQKFAY